MHKFPKSVGIVIIAVTAMPFIFSLVGADFSSNSSDDGSKGAFVHLILEWSAVVISLLTAILAFIQYRITGTVSTPIIGMALFCAGCMDAFHTLATAKLLPFTPADPSFIPFTWTLSRTFNALIFILGTSIFLFNSRIDWDKGKRKFYIFGICVCFALISYIVIRISSNIHLPVTIYEDAIIKRPYDLIPLFLFLVLALGIFPRFFSKEHSIFSHSLMWSVIPAIATQLHMVFGSSQLYDAHFNIAHFLKMVSYLVPMMGMILDYYNTHLKEKKRSEALKRSKEAIKDLMKKKDEFLSIASHELKTPITSMKGFLQILDRMADAENYSSFKTFLTKANKQVIKLTALVHNLMDVTKLQEGHMLLNISEFKVTELIADAIEQIEYMSNHNIVTDGNVNIKISGDQFRLEQVLANFLSNAIKHSPGEQKIIITVKTEDNDIIFSVTDFGMGIKKEKIGQISQKFYRAEETSIKYTGLGLGLYISNDIIKRHHGKMWIESEEGKGSTFYFRIPVSQEKKYETL